MNPIITCGPYSIHRVSDYSWRFEAQQEDGQMVESTEFISLYASIYRMREMCGWRRATS